MKKSIPSSPAPKTAVYNARSEMIRSVLFGMVPEKHEKLICKVHRAACRLDMIHYYENPRRLSIVEISVKEMAAKAEFCERTIEYDLDYINQFFDITGWRLHIWEKGDLIPVIRANGEEGLKRERNKYQFPSPWRLTIEDIHIDIEMQINQKKILPHDADMERLITRRYIDAQINSEKMKELKHQRDLDLEERRQTIGNEPLDEKMARQNNRLVKKNLERLSIAGPATKSDCIESVRLAMETQIIEMCRSGSLSPEWLFDLGRRIKAGEYQEEED